MVEQSPPAIASYNHADLKEGISTQELYGYASEESDGEYDYHLGTFQTYSRTRDTDELTVNSTTTFTFYSGAFNRARTMYGTFHLMFAWGVNEGITCTPSVKLYHYDGSTSTQLGSTWTGDDEHGAGVFIENASVAVTADGGKRFKRGDQIKMEITLTCSAPGTQIWLGCDPMNRDGVFITPTDGISTTQIVARAPWKTDI